ncbi:MAG: carbonic anhydrase [Hydrocarboniphaga sp.]|uniref:gamma carbonic anhydrase family protein n=1 Tax=Hydrocarboniphaga sp. TaxID=2033016 RepID=UPI00260182A1|nr:gamma carbonic anhydrase family protein [Hydrocarboniphaga sp.]MDB5969395.1 carbonic anhydrase [Hydrocarboniphaga sp.]
MIRSYQGISPTLGHAVYIDELALVQGAVTLGDDVSIWPFAALRGDVNKMAVGARSNVQDNAVLHATHDGPYTPGGLELSIGEDVTVGHGAILHACTVGDRVLIGMGAIVLDKAVIDSDVILAAGSLVPPNKRLKSGWLYRGSPAVAVRELTRDERDNFTYSTAHYVRLKNRHLQDRQERPSP